MLSMTIPKVNISENKEKRTKTLSENTRLGVSSPQIDEDFELWDQSGFMLRNDMDDYVTNSKWGAQSWCKPSCIPITVILVLIVLVVLLPLLDAADKQALNSTRIENNSKLSCMDSCSLSLIESIPIGLNYSNNSVIHQSTYQTWKDLIESAQSTIEIGSYYWTMKREDVYPHDSAKEGEDVFQALLEAGRDRRVTLKIAQNAPSQVSPNTDTEFLSKKANAQVRSLNFAALIGAGILHTKLWIIDRKHVYVGSANMDWRALTQVKELGFVAMNCSCLAEDIAKVFDVYWLLGEKNQVPTTWPANFSTKINVKNPMTLTLDNVKYRTFFSSAPPKFSPPGRTDDIDAILHCIEKAEKFIYISVMDYIPMMIYTPKFKFWPVIDNALKIAAIERKVNVRLLISWWKHSRMSEDHFLKSLEDLTNSYKNVKIEVRRFIVPTTPDFDQIPYSRVNHNKYMVTDGAAYIGTSNWSGDYFVDTAGVSATFEDDGVNNKKSLRKQLENVFLRDWNSPYVHLLNASCWNQNPERNTRRRGPLQPTQSHHVPA
ncbi:5'-3' exonuclease PLD3-like isoform X2 [Leptopilina boulardi]|uniref:5'-3' exonuclease PLD3-like isoform X2 n=1 Tax=Leptopilina boulardi TaxID=63433 RepID=UPI0021F65E0D|nr:5'-3' exonuclease PLD3-like isoform X2 [Leptopilina boulardi]